MQIPELERGRLVTQRLVNGWLAVSLVSLVIWAATQGIKFIENLS